MIPANKDVEAAMAKSRKLIQKQEERRTRKNPLAAEQAKTGDQEAGKYRTIEEPAPDDKLTDVGVFCSSTGEVGDT